MALVIPRDVGGKDETQPPITVPVAGAPAPTPVPAPVQPQARQIIVPADVGGAAPSVQPQPAQAPAVGFPGDIEQLEARRRIFQETEPARRGQRFGVERPPTEVPLTPQEVSFFETEEERRAGTRAARELPELGERGLLREGGLLEGESVATAALVAPAILLTTNEREIGQILQENFPNIGITQDPGGNLLATNNKTGRSVIINRPGLSKIDLLQGLGITAAFTPAARGAAAAPTIGARVGVGGVGAAATQTVIEGVQAALGGELNPEEIALAGTFGAGAEAIAPAIQAIRNARRARQAQLPITAQLPGTEEAVRQAQEAQEQLARVTGQEVPLFPAQRAAVPAALEEQAFVGQLPAGTQTARDALLRQNEAAANAVDEILNVIAPPSAVETGAARIRTAAQKALDAGKAVRAERTSPLFNQAFDEGADVTLKPVRDLIAGKIDDFPEGGEVQNVMKRISRLISGKKGIEPSLRKLQNAKLEIDQIISKFGEGSLGNTTKREVLEVKNALLAQMDEASPLFRQAREEFAALSPAVGELEQSIIGRIANIDDTQLKTISRRLLDPAETNPAVVQRAKRIIQDIDPGAWDEIVRTELERRLGVVKADLQEAGLGVSASIENVPAQLERAIFGNQKQSKVLFNALDDETRKNMKFLQTVLKRASLGRPGGSQTAVREEIKKRLNRGVLSSIRNFFSKPVTTLVNIGEEAGFDRRTAALADAVFNPDFRPQLERLRRLDPNSPAAARAMAQLLKDADEGQEEGTEQ